MQDSKDLKDAISDIIDVDYIYRFTDFINLVDMVENKKITLVSPELWDDTYENYFLKKLKNPNYFKKLYDYLFTFEKLYEHFTNGENYKGEKYKFDIEIIKKRLNGDLFQKTKLFYSEKLSDIEYCKNYYGSNYNRISVELQDFKKFYEQLKDSFLYIFLSKNLYYGQSWSFHSESDALWRIYTTNKNNSSIRIKVNTKKIIEMNEVLSKKHITFGCKKIIYQEKLNFDEMLKINMQEKNINGKTGILLDNNKTSLYKRTPFKHENEFRLFICDNNMIKKYYYDLNFKFEDLELTPEYFIELEERINKSVPKIYNIDINPFTLIESVTVSPFAKPYIVDTIKAYCERKKIKFEGQSKLYDFK